MISSSWPRSFSAGLATALALTACSGDETDQTSSASATSASSGAASPSDPANPHITLKGGDPAMAEALKGVYAGHGEFEGSVTTGEWKGEKVAVVTGDSDATLLVGKGSTWTVVGGWWP